MLKYLIIPLASDAVPFCHYPASTGKPLDFPSDILKKAIFWAMRENLSVQFVYPSRPIAAELKKIVDSIDHVDITPEETSTADSDRIVVMENWQQWDTIGFIKGTPYVIRTSLPDLLANPERIKSVLPRIDRLNIVLADVETTTEDSLRQYNVFLESCIPTVVAEYTEGHAVQLNILTDRISLTGMNNCNAGDESITLAPDGNFYICPGFYNAGMAPVGNIESGLDIKNPQLYKLTHAPICRECDAFQCKRCVWLNKHLTREVNTPGREQCLIAHIERNASRKLLEELRKTTPEFLPETSLPEIDYLDPFDKILNTNI